MKTKQMENENRLENRDVVRRSLPEQGEGPTSAEVVTDIKVCSIIYYSSLQNSKSK